MTTFTVNVRPTGKAQAIYVDAPELVELMQALGPTRIRRASSVEPTDDNRWTADMAASGGPILGPFDRRAQALAAEVSWLRQHLKSPPGRPGERHISAEVQRPGGVQGVAS